MIKSGALPHYHTWYLKNFVSTFRKKSFIHGLSLRNLRFMSFKEQELPLLKDFMSPIHLEAVTVAIKTGDSANLPTTFEPSCRTLTAKKCSKVPKLSSFDEWSSWWSNQLKFWSARPLLFWTWRLKAMAAPMPRSLNQNWALCPVK